MRIFISKDNNRVSKQYKTLFKDASTEHSYSERNVHLSLSISDIVDEIGASNTTVWCVYYDFICHSETLSKIISSNILELTNINLW